MRKIISILVTLGVILGLTLVAVPVAGQVTMDGVECPTDCTPIAIDDLLGPPDFCAGMESTYLLGDNATTILLPQTLIAGTDSLSVEFPADTDLSNVAAIDVWVYSQFWLGWAQPAAITVTDQHLEFVVPIGFWPSLPAGDIIMIEVQDVINPTVAGDYCLFVDYMDDCCTPVVFDCVEYTVSPAFIDYGCHFDFDKSYTGIAEDFIPPFQACGQNQTGVWNATVGWMNVFDLILRDENGGCLPGCTTNLTMWFELTACPPGETVTFHFDTLGTVGGPFMYTLTNANVGTEYPLPDVDPSVAPPPDVLWECELHFSSPGEYELCFYFECPAVSCGPGAKDWYCCMPVKVYQWKQAWKIPLEPKWNLISLPLFPFNTDIDAIWAALNHIDQLKSVWYFDQCDPAGVPDTGTWFVRDYDGALPGSGDLETMEAGKGYWVRMLHLGDVGFNATPTGGWPQFLWVFGHHSPMPPDDPMPVFDVCDGWNMVGFKPPWIINDPDAPLAQGNKDYLWNWWDITGAWPDYSSIYEWLAATQNWKVLTPGNLVADQLNPGLGYWIAFEYDGPIYPAA